MKSHTGGTLLLGKGSVYSALTRQKLNTKSSTKAELVGVDDVMLLILWTRYFLDAQGYGVQENKVFQDNESAILLEKSGHQSSSCWTRHNDIHYFFVMDQIQSKEFTVEYCPTGEMLADMFTNKPLQGSLFRCFRDAVMNMKTDCPAATTSAPVHRSVLKNNDESTDVQNAVQSKIDVAGKVRVD